MQKESQLEKSILQYLAYRQILAFKVKTIGTYDEKLGRFRSSSKWYRKGVADIIGIYKNRPLAIEVKTEKGKLSVHQKNFLSDWEIGGGISIVARSLEDLDKQLQALDSVQLAHAALGEVDDRLLVTAYVKPSESA